jgi:O-antigen/teichoic acid export membrane protein
MAVLRSISFMWLASLFAAGFALLSQMMIARAVRPSDYGLYAGALTAAAIVAPLAGLGVSGFLLRVFGEEGPAARRWIKGCLTAMSCSLCAGILVCAAYTVSLSTDTTGLIVGLALAPLILSFVGAEIAISRYQVEGNHVGVSAWTVIPNLLRVAVALAGWLLNWGIVWISVGIGVVSTAVGVWAWLTLLRAQWKEQPSGNPPQPRALEKVPVGLAAASAWPFGLSNFVFLVYFQSGVLMLATLSSHSAAGVFSLGLSILTAVYLVPTVVAQRYLMVKFHHWATHRPAHFLVVFRTCLGVALFSGLVMAVAVALLAPYFVHAAFGSAYDEVGAVLAMASLCIPARYLSCFLAAAYGTFDNMKPRLRTQMVLAVGMVPLSFIAISSHGLLGATVAMVLSEWAMALAYLLGCVRHVFGVDALRGWNLNLRALRSNR